MSLYDVLGLGRDASEAQVRRAYRRLARRWHPDLNPGNAEAARRYAAITEAFETLVDPGRRRAYDAAGAAPPPSPAVAPAFAGFDFSLTVQGAQASTFGDLFVDVFREAAGHARAVRGGDVHADVTLSLTDVLHGATRALQVHRRVACRICRGHGTIDATPVPCQVCGGAGQQRLGRGHMVFVRACESCHGAGVVRRRPCHGCHGRSQHDDTERVVVTLPPGLGEGDRLVQAGEGHAGVRGGAPGDLHLHVRVASEAGLTRVGHDLHMTLPVAVHEAVLGARIRVPTADGAVLVRVPPGTQGGQRLRLRHRGVPSAGAGRGDLVLQVHLVLPPVLDARARALMTEFARLHPEDVRAAWYASPDTTTIEDTAASTVSPDEADAVVSRAEESRHAPRADPHAGDLPRGEPEV
jgi:molecular chaperone DnaJ